MSGIFILDSRSFRDVQLPPADLSDPTAFLIAAFDPTRTLLGRAQVDQLKADLLDAQENGILWKFVVIPEPIQNFGVVNAEDRYEGYAAERTEILNHIAANGIENVVFMAGDFHGTIVNNLTYQLSPVDPQIPTNAFEIVTGPVAFFNGLFGPTVVQLAFDAGFIGEAELGFYESLPVDGDMDSKVDDKDDFVKQLINTQTGLLGYDPVGLNDNLPEADGYVDAELLDGDYIAVHTFGWTEMDVDPETFDLLVTTYGMEPYSEEDFLADPAEILGRVPFIVSQFVVHPIGDVPCPGDVTGDDVVDVLDMLAVLDAWGTEGSMGEDLNGNGVVDVVDLLMLLAAWGAC